MKTIALIIIACSVFALLWVFTGLLEKTIN